MTGNIFSSLYSSTDFYKKKKKTIWGFKTSHSGEFKVQRQVGKNSVVTTRLLPNTQVDEANPNSSPSFLSCPSRCVLANAGPLSTLQTNSWQTWCFSLSGLPVLFGSRLCRSTGGHKVSFLFLFLGKGVWFLQWQIHRGLLALWEDLKHLAVRNDSNR